MPASKKCVGNSAAFGEAAEPYVLRTRGGDGLKFVALLYLLSAAALSLSVMIAIACFEYWLDLLEGSREIEVAYGSRENFPHIA